MRTQIPHISKRYPGVQPFSTSEHFLFFGRKKDAEDLNKLIYLEPIVVLHGKSGYGKSSLINAGVIPKLEQYGFTGYFSVRFNNYNGDKSSNTPLMTITQKISSVIRPQIEEDNTLNQLIPDENSLWYWIKQQQFLTGKNSFIIFFDQFEELFTYLPEQIEAFSEQLSQLLYVTLPANYTQKLQELEAKGSIDNDFHDFLYKKPEVKIVISMRSDRLSMLNKITDRHPGILRYCYELQALNANDARKAITEPAGLPQEIGFESPKFSYTDDAIEKIMKGISSQDERKEISAATLQIVCREVEKMVMKGNLSEISESDIPPIGGILQRYYTDILDTIANDNDRTMVQKLIEDELIINHSRNALGEQYIIGNKGVSPTLLDALEKSTLLRKERDAYERIFYEISHDSLIAPIEEVREQRKIMETAEKEKQDLLKAESEKKVLLERLAVKTKRQHELEALKRRWKAFAIVCVSALFAGAYFYYEAKTAKEKLEKTSCVANEALARIYMERGDNSDKSVDASIQTAISEYKKALEFLNQCDNKDENLYTQITKKLNECEK